jgi:Tfp pilus assembly protein PilX
MREALKQIHNENGVVLVVALIILGLLMVIGTSITMTSSIELNIARNEKVAKTAFYRAENARVIAGMALRSAEGGTTWANGDNFGGNPLITMADGGFYAEDFTDADDRLSSPDMRWCDTEPCNTDDPETLLARVDIDKIEVGPAPGASAEFGSGYEGTGHEGMIQAIYQIDSVGQEPSGALAEVRLEYRILPY